MRYNCVKICSWSRRTATILEIKQKAPFLEVINKYIIYKFFKAFINHRYWTQKDGYEDGSF